MATIYTVSNKAVEVEPQNGYNFSLEELQNIVGGYIEIVRLPNDQIMVVNEEGHLLGLDFNHRATIISHQLIIGDVLVCHSNQVL